MEKTIDEKLRYAEMWRQQQLMNNGCGTPMVYLLLAVFIMCCISFDFSNKSSHVKYDFFKANSAEIISCATPV